MEVDDAKVFKILDLEDIEKTFSAYQRQQVLRTMQPISPFLNLDLACVEIFYISPVLQLLISQAKLEKGRGQIIYNKNKSA